MKIDFKYNEALKFNRKLPQTNKASKQEPITPAQKQFTLKSAALE